MNGRNHGKRFQLGMALVLLLTGSVKADERGFGIGIMVGEPTGITVKQWTGSHNAWDAALGWSFVGGSSSINFHADYLWHDFKFLRGQDAGLSELSLFYGIGGRFKNTIQSQVGVRVPLGVNYQAAKSALELFVEIVPILNLTPGTALSINGALGLRLYLR